MNINIPNKKFATSKMEEFKPFLKARFDKAVEARDEKADRFERGYKLYEGLLPIAHKDDVAPIVVPIVRNVIDKLQPSLMNIFTENEEQAVVFRPQRTTLPEEVVEAVNLRINEVFLRENDGYNALSNAFREALITGDTFMKVFIEQETIEEEVDIDEGWMPAELFLAMLADFPDTDPEQIEVSTKKVDGPDGQKMDLDIIKAEKLVLTRIERKPCIEFVPFNEVFVLSDTVNIADTRYACHRVKRSVGELIDMGFDKALIEEASNNASEGRDLSTKKLANDETLGDDDMEDDQFIDPMEKEMYLYEHYIYTSYFDKKGKSCLYQVYAVDVDKVLEINEIARIPFVHGVMDNIPGSFWGTSISDRFGDDQEFMSNILRDYATYSKALVHPKWMTIKGQYDKASLLNVGRPGAVVEQNQPGAITPFSPAGSPGDLLQVLQFVQGNANEGIMNTVGAQVDPASMMNATATAVAVSVHNTEMKDKKIAKALAYTLIRPLFEMLYKMFRDEDLVIPVQAKMQGPDGQMVEDTMPFQGSQLPSRSEFYIDVNTANDDAQQVQTLMTTISSLAQLSAVQSPVITPMNLYRMGKRLLRSADINNVDDYLTDPSTVTPSPEEIAMQQQIAEDQRQREQDMFNAQVGLAVAQQVEVETRVSEAILMNKHQRDKEERELLMKMEELEVKRMSAEAKIEVEKDRQETREEELELEAKTGMTIGIS